MPIRSLRAAVLLGLALSAFILAVSCTTLTAVPTSAPLTGQCPADAPDSQLARETFLKVIVTPLRTNVRIGDFFEVRLQVVNSSQSPQSFQVMSCSWNQHWKSSNDRIVPEGWACWSNIAETKNLAPGEAYEEILKMSLVSGKPGDKISFRMAFSPFTKNDQTYWSNPVTVQADPRMER
jgi:hypothetical protein